MQKLLDTTCITHVRVLLPRLHMVTGESHDEMTTECGKDQHQQQKNNLEPTDDITTCMYPRHVTCVAWWPSDWHRTCNREVTGSSPGRSAPGDNSGQVVHTHVPLFIKQYKLVSAQAGS